MEKSIVYVVDDDPSARDSLCWLLNTEGFETLAFDSADSLLSAWSRDWKGCITLDIRMPGKNGLLLQQDLNMMNNLLPIIILTGHADVPIAIRAMKQGAFEFLEKPYSDRELLTAVMSALKVGAKIDEAEIEKNKMISAVKSLTAREREVMLCVVEGNTNKLIAAELGISEKTVEIHRKNVMQKTRAGSLSGLVRIGLRINIRN